VHGEDKAHCLAQVVVDSAPEPNGFDDRAEIVVKQHDRGCLPRHVGPASTHGNANVRRFERRRIIDIRRDGLCVRLSPLLFI
jgi:hypothetical protein